MTMVRGVAPEPEPAPADPSEDDPVGMSSLDLGTPDHGTMLRPMAVPTARREESRREPERAQRRKKPPKWRDPRAIAIVVASVVLLGGAVAYATTTDDSAPEPDPGATTAPVAPAINTYGPLPTGLEVDRQAVYDPQTETVELTLTYTAQSAELSGPFLEVIPGTDGGDCPPVTWLEGGEQEQNIPTSTGINLACGGWSVDPGPVPRQGSAVVTATVPLAFEDPATELQEWLDQAGAATEAAVTDGTVSGSAYPVQRLQSVRVIAPSRLTINSPVPLTVNPVWPSGEDTMDPMYTPESQGSPSMMLTAVTGGEQGLRFFDNCGGALTVQNGLSVTATGPATDCTVLTTVGNLPDVESSPFDIVTRGS
jgi:serine/threonine-protein kinase